MRGKLSHLSQICSARRYVLTEGAERGLEIIDCDNGKLRFLLNVSKALDMPQLWHESTNLSFVSKNGLVAKDRSFLDRFEGGMLYTCGMDSVGGRDGYELHGSLHNTPARVTFLQSDKDGICVEAEIRSTALFGKHLLLKRRIHTAQGSSKVTVTDTLINEGYAPEDYCLLYHVNLGYPMLDEGTRIEAEPLSVIPRTPWAKAGQDEIFSMSGAIPGREEQCWFLTMKEPRVSLVNEGLGKHFVLSWSGDTLPHFVEWKSMASGDYALGLEPSTTELDGGFAYRTIAPGERIRFSVTMEVKKS